MGIDNHGQLFRIIGLSNQMSNGKRPGGDAYPAGFELRCHIAVILKSAATKDLPPINLADPSQALGATRGGARETGAKGHLVVLWRLVEAVAQTPDRAPVQVVDQIAVDPARGEDAVLRA